MGFFFRHYCLFYIFTLLLMLQSVSGDAEQATERPGTSVGSDDYGRVQLLLEQGVYGEAARELEARLEEDPDDVSARRMLCRAYAEMKEYQKLLHNAEVLLEMHPDDEDAGEWVATAKKELDAALPEMRRGLEASLVVDPENVRARLELIGLLERAEEYEEAMHHFQVLIRQRPDDIDLTLRYARFLANAGLLEKAENSYLRYLEEKPDPQVKNEMLDVILRRGRVLFDSERYDEAVAHFERVVKLYPEELRLRLQYARMLSWAGFFSESIEVYREYIELTDDPRQALFEKYRVLAWDEQYVPSALGLREFIERYPEDLDARALLADLYRWTNDTEMAAELYGDILEENPEHEAALRGMKEIEQIEEIRMEETQRLSIPYLEERVDQDPENLGDRLQLARLYGVAGRYREACEQFSFYLRERPEDMAVRREYANALGFRGQYGEAVREFWKYLEEFPDDVTARMQVANYLKWDEKIEEAKRELLKIVEIVPGHKDAHWQLAQISRLAEDWDAALFHYERLQEKAPGYKSVDARIRRIKNHPRYRLFDLERRVDKNPDALDLRSELAEMLLDMGRYHEALEEAESVLAVDESYPKALHAAKLSEEKIRRRRNEELEEMRFYLRNNPRDLDKHLEYGRLLKKDGRYEDAMQRYRFYLRSRPDDSEARREYATLLSWLEEYRDEAIKEFRELVSYYPEDYDLRLQYARMLSWEREYYDEAEEELEELRHLNPDSLEAMNLLADIYRYTGRYRAARELYEKVAGTGTSGQDKDSGGNGGGAGLPDRRYPYSGGEDRSVTANDDRAAHAEDAQRGLGAINRLLRPRLSGMIGGMSDNEGYSQFQMGIRYHHFLSGGTQLHAGLSRYRFKEKDVNRARANAVSVGMKGRLAERTTAEGYIRLTEFDLVSRTSVTGALRMNYEAGAASTASLGYERYDAIHEVKTVRSLEEGIDADRLKFEWQSEPPGRVEQDPFTESVFFNGHLSYGVFSDGNRQTSFRLRPFYRIKDWPSVDLRAGWSGLYYSKDSEHYWSPSSYEGPLAGMRIRGDGVWKLNYDLQFEFFFPANTVARSVSLYLQRNFTEKFAAGLDLFWSESTREDDSRYRHSGAMLDAIFFF